MSRAMQGTLFAAAIGLGLLIGYIDSRPTWDDTGVTVGLLLIGTGVLGLLGPGRPWLLALCVGIWVPLFGLTHGPNYGSLIALVVALVGAYGGTAVRRAVIPR